MKSKSHLTVVGIGFAVSLLCAAAHGVGNFHASDLEMSLLPPYCATVGGPTGTRIMTPEAKKWATILGPEYYDIHHYCDGLLHWNLAQRTFRDAEKRRFYLAQALDGFEYVEARARPEFILNAELAYFKGRTLLEMNKALDAIESFRRANKFQPNYAPPYAALADYYLSIGNKAEAHKILGEGLKQAPDAESLKRRLHELK